MRRKTEKKGFTILEVMLFLAITGLMLIGVIGGTYSAIASQRYTDSVRSFAEFLRQTYAEVISPETLKEQGGNDNELAIYGKAIVFGLDGENTDTKSQYIYTATLVGNATIPSSVSASTDFVSSLGEVNLQFYCGDDNHASTVASYLPLWEAKIMEPAKTTNSNGIPDPGKRKETFKGTVLIARSPGSGAIHTVYAPELMFNIKNQCGMHDSDPRDPTAKVDGTDKNLTKALKENKTKFEYTKAVDFCIKEDQTSDESRMRDIRLAADGRNTSAVSLVDMDSEESKCR